MTDSQTSSLLCKSPLREMVLLAVGLAFLFFALGTAPRLEFLADDWFFLEVIHRHGPGGLFAAFVRLMNGVFFRPVTAILWIVDSAGATFGLNFWHYTNFLLHGANALLVAILTFKISRRHDAAMLAGLLFLAHPVQAEAVFWISGRFDLLCLCLSLLALIFYLGDLQAPSRLRRLAAWICALLAMGAKETGIPAIAVVFGFEAINAWERRQPDGPDGGLARRPFAGAGARVAGIISVYVLYFLLRLLGNGSLFPDGPAAAPNWESIGTRSTIAITHLFLPIWPGTEADWPGLRSVIAAGLVLAAGLALWHRPRPRFILDGLLLLLLPLAPALLYPWDQKEFAGSRVLYLPAAGMSLLLGIFFAPGKNANPRVRRFAALAGLVLVIAFATQLHANRKPYLEAARMIAAVKDQLAREPKAARLAADLYLLDFPRRQSGVMLFLNDNALAAARRMMTAAERDQEPLPPQPRAFHAGRLGPLEYIHRFPDDEAVRSGAVLVYQWDPGAGRLNNLNPAIVEALDRRSELVDPMSAPLPDMMLADGDRLLGLFPRLGISAESGFFRIDRQGAYFESGRLEVNPLLVDKVEIVMTAWTEGNGTKEAQGQLYWRSTREQGCSEDNSVLFDVTADGAPRTYSLDLARNPDFLLEQKLILLRFDPMKTPGRIVLHSFVLHPVRRKKETP